MRLIDADKLYMPPEDIGSRMTVAYAPTAYDVDAVIEELKASCCENRYCVDCFDCYFKQAINKAIEIVKRGGVE